MNALDTNYTQFIQNEESESVKNLKTRKSLAVDALAFLAWDIDVNQITDPRTIADRIYAIREALR